MSEEPSIKLSLSQADLLRKVVSMGTYLNPKNQAVIALAKSKLIESVIRPRSEDKIGDYWVATDAGRRLVSK